MAETHEELKERINRITAAIVDETRLRLPQEALDRPDEKVLSVKEALAVAEYAARVCMYAVEYGSDISFAAALANDNEDAFRDGVHPLDLSGAH